ncbi:MAG: SDR family oxidoreductase [Alphaproteobacteria bacterium]
MTHSRGDPYLAQLLDLSGKSAVVTGAAHGIGFAISRRLTEAGARVAMIDVDDQALTKAARELTNGETVPVTADITDSAILAKGIECAFPDGAPIDIWVNNAGAAPRQPLLEISAEEWERVLSLNLTASLSGAQIAAKRMIANRTNGVIINIVSSTVHRVSSNPAHYRASKAGLKALTENLAVDLGKYGIRAVAIAPGLTETPQVERLRDELGSEGFETFARRLPLKRIGQADEVARAVLFAASDMASFVTGCVINVDGGEAVK